MIRQDRTFEAITVLYVFRTNNALRIAWDYKVPNRSRESRLQQLDTRFSLFGLIRSSSAG